jgi:Ca2+-binding RTX toxin-like protein
MATITGTKSNNSIAGTSGADTISGGAGKDIITGGAGDDILYGGAGKDFLYGGDGNDVLKGGGGQDSLTGGAGADQFVFRSAEGFAPFSFSGGHGVAQVWQWVIVTDLTFADGDNVRITGFDDILGGLNMYRKGTGSYFLDGQEDINAMVNFLNTNPTKGSYYEVIGGQYDGITFLLNDNLGHTQALTLNGIHPDSIVV